MIRIRTVPSIFIESGRSSYGFVLKAGLLLVEAKYLFSIELDSYKFRR